MAAMVAHAGDLDVVHGRKVPPMFPFTEHRIRHGGLTLCDQSKYELGSFDYFRSLLPGPITETFVDVKGQLRPVRQLLSYNGKTVSLVHCNTGSRVDFDAAVKGKTLIITCISLPVLTASREMSFCHSIIAACSDLRDKNCEMVVIPIMKPGFTERQPLFDNFFNRFPCLGLPFSENDARDSICSSLGWGFSSGGLIKGINTVMLDPQGNVLQHRDATYNFYFSGFLWYPFRDPAFDELKTQYELCRIGSLPSLQ